VKALPAAAIAAATLASSAFAATPSVIPGNYSNGKKLFKAHQCGSCHMLYAAGSMNSSGVGPDLDTSKKTYQQMITQITKGGKGMSPYKGVLTTSQIQDLANFVYTASHTSQ
jgi:mono/diheme cytochrome c family protein